MGDLPANAQENGGQVGAPTFAEIRAELGRVLANRAFEQAGRADRYFEPPFYAGSNGAYRSLCQSCQLIATPNRRRALCRPSAARPPPAPAGARECVR